MVKCKLLLVTFIIMNLCLPAAALAQPDAYGYNETARIFVGSFENWENFVYGRPAIPSDPNATDALFLVRKWSKEFDESMFHGKPWRDGSWQMAHFYQYLSGDKQEWTWNWTFKIVYSSTPIEGGTVAWDKFYFIQDKTWLTDPQGNETVLQETYVIPPSLGKGFYK